MLWGGHRGVLERASRPSSAAIARRRCKLHDSVGKPGCVQVKVWRSSREVIAILMDWHRTAQRTRSRCTHLSIARCAHDDRMASLRSWRSSRTMIAYLTRDDRAAHAR
jgi:hypothetical protein